nr:RING finger and CHY zinc finger domain-containing protein 1 isoform X3 [Equus caballus]
MRPASRPSSGVIARLRTAAVSLAPSHARGVGGQRWGKRRVNQELLPLTAKAATNVDGRDCVSPRFRPVAAGTGNPAAPGHVPSRHIGSGGSCRREGAPCCDKLYTCRLCHDNNEDHQLDRFKVKEVQCINCEKIQHAQQTCEECSTLFGEYYCSICHLFDKDKKQYHCENCGICRIGPKEDFFHCLKCNLCLAMNLQGKHKCIENVSRQNCPICLEDIHTSRVVAHVLPCGHLLHRGYRCPLCMHSALDMTRYWRQLDDEVAQTPMPSEYQNMTVDILCNDCNGRSTVQFHILGMKCNICDSYNTAQAGGCRISLGQQ